MKPLTIRVRLTLWYVGLLAVILAAFGAGVYFTVQTTLYRNIDGAIEARANTILASVAFDSGHPILPPLPSPIDDAEFVRVAHIGRPPAETDPEIRVGRFPILHNGEAVALLEVGLSGESVTEALSALLLTLGVAYPLTLLVAVLGGMFLARRALAPVDSITEIARRISAEDLGQRLDLQLPNDELGRLATTFDGMIDRLDDAFRRQRRFNADASHELRTPLTVMKGQVEVALQQERSPEDYRKVLRAVNDEVDRLIGLAGSLLTLARAEAGQIPLSLERVDVAELVSATVEQIRPAATAKGLSIDLVPTASVSMLADEGLILQLLLNLLDNAVKYTPEGGRISVGWDTTNDGLEIWVATRASAFRKSTSPHVTDRFYRVDDARSRAEGGVGLGLAINRWIAEAHGGSLLAESVVGEGSAFRVTLPPAS